ncbi:Transmembrane protein 163 [Stylophora pistillata]|uniref:Transmembrane protein 163 n=1 Tax=Stylophora pistillata TaxID=50429 RepID=A0A2B4RSL6_STYPI|nr:Transmembrane protein 163 [Stylophora pistillata]
MGEKKYDNLELRALVSQTENEQNTYGIDGEKSEDSSIDKDEFYAFWRKAAICVSCASIILTTGFGGTFFALSQIAGSPAAFGFALTKNPFSTVLSAALSQIAGSPAAFGFALAAVLDSFSSAVVLWRFSFKESRKVSNSSKRERRACTTIAVCFILSAFAITAKAIYTLLEDKIPSKEFLMEMLSVGSFLHLVFLTAFKCLIADKLESRAMRIDAINSLAGAVMTLGMVASDVICLNNPKICYLDSVTAILIAIALFCYGVATIAELKTGEGKKPLHN